MHISGEMSAEVGTEISEKDAAKIEEIASEGRQGRKEKKGKSRRRGPETFKRNDIGIHETEKEKKRIECIPPVQETRILAAATRTNVLSNSLSETTPQRSGLEGGLVLSGGGKRMKQKSKLFLRKDTTSSSWFDLLKSAERAKGGHCWTPNPQAYGSILQ